MVRLGNNSGNGIKLSLKDRKILQELNRNARQSSSSIAKKIRVSKQAVTRRINRMLREGVIKGFITYIDTQKLGYTYYNLYLQLGWISNEDEKELEEFFEKEPSITWAASGVGRWNLIISVLVKDATEFHKVSVKIFNQCKSMINHANFITTEAYTLPHQYLFQDLPKQITKTASYVSQKSEPVRLKEEDMKILWELSKNARMSNTELSQKLNMKMSTIQYRITRMEKTGVIQAYKPLISASKIGRNRHLVMLKLNYKNKEQEQKLLNYLKELPYTKFIAKGIGRWDFTVTIHEKDMKQFDQIINQLRENFKDISMFESTAILRIYKNHYFPQTLLPKS